MIETDVALSDIALGILALGLAWHHRAIANHPIPRLYPAMQWILLSTVVGAWLGAYWHAFLVYDAGMTAWIIWRLTLLSIGFTAYGFALLGLNLCARGQLSVSLLFIRIMLSGYVIALLLFDHFLLAIAIYLPSVLLACWGLIHLPAWQEKFIALSGLTLIIMASAYQQWGPDLHPLWLTHNTIYHLLLIVALSLLYIGIAKLKTEPNRY